MFVLFEEAGKFLAGRILSESATSAQVELASGKRAKVKEAYLLIRFERPEPQLLLEQAQAIGPSIELDLAWEFVGDEEFGFKDLAREYFGSSAGKEPGVEQQAATLLRLHDAPHYFRRAGRGRFKRAPAELLRQALAAIERKRQVQLQIDEWAGELARGHCPAPLRAQLFKILFKPDKNAPEYRAVVEAARRTKTAPLALLRQSGAIDSPYQFHWQRFLFENFPKGTAFPPLPLPAPVPELPLAPVAACSIDDSSTTEIDDALSVQGLGSGSVTLGIHIAVPALALAPGDAVDVLARTRLSTVYMPGHKVTMLPAALISAFTLAEGRACPALSLYLSFDEATLAVTSAVTRLERVPIAANLRLDALDALVTEEWLDQDGADLQATLPESMGHAQLAFLFRLARQLKAQRELVRGKPETFNRPDYNFRLHGQDGTAPGEDGPSGNEQVSITTRRRGAPLDLIVAEAMILANSHWGQWLADLGVPAIYRSQASLAPGVKVRMGTRALPHAGIGVKCYAWSTSPLRRYTDLVNQWQIIACVRHGSAAALVAPFKPKDAALFAIISAFDAAHAAYQAHQAAMERFWTLRCLEQQGVGEISATLFKEGLARADEWQLVLPVLGAGQLPRGAHLLLRLSSIDTMTLEVSGTLLRRLDGDDAALASVPEQAGQEDEGEDGEDEGQVGGPIHIAMDLADVPAESELPASDELPDGVTKTEPEPLAAADNSSP
jgi:exoribonuclease-2